MRVLVACEFSGIVREAFKAQGADAWSCDFLPSEIPGQHYQGDIRDLLRKDKGKCWDLMIAHPPCTHLTLAGARWFYDPRFPNKKRDQRDAIEFFKYLQDAPIKRIAIENPQPLGVVMDEIGKYDQKIQPWQFSLNGDEDETKGICLWLKNLPPLVPWVTKKPDIVRERVWRMAPGPERQKERSRFFRGVAQAMAEQWFSNLSYLD